MCYETNFLEACQQKTTKYQDLVEACEVNGYTTELVTLEVGSRGFLNLQGFKALFQGFSLNKCEKYNFLRVVSREAIIGSHKIWTARNSMN